jgi:hypothetical protein
MTSVKEPHFQHQHNFTPTEKKMQQKNKKMAGEKGDRRETRETRAKRAPSGVTIPI